MLFFQVQFYEISQGCESTLSRIPTTFTQASLLDTELQTEIYPHRLNFRLISKMGDSRSTQNHLDALRRQMGTNELLLVTKLEILMEFR